MSRIADAFEKAKQENRAALITFVEAGDPSLAKTKEVLMMLQGAGADIIELGVPFSDPVADGPTIQAASERALKAGASLAGVLTLLTSARKSRMSAPIVLFTYFNPILKMGIENFFSKSAKAGADGVLIVDLPIEEALRLKTDQIAKAHGMDLIFLASPTTSPERLEKTDRHSTGFIYYVSKTGVTGASKDLPAALATEVRAIKAKVKSNLAVGFGISAPKHVQMLKNAADGVVVGSALVDLLAKEFKVGKKSQKTFKALSQSKKLIQELKKACNR